MVALLKVADQIAGTHTSDRRTEVVLRLASERSSAREIIRSRVVTEVQEINRAREVNRTGVSESSYLVGKSEAELNGGSTKAWSWAISLHIDAEVDRAITAFSRGRFIMLLDDRQIEGLDEPIGLRPDSEIVFLHLTPLKGG
jgi:hypothetical protein